MDVFEQTLINLRVLQSLQCHARLDTTEPLFKIHTPLTWVPIWLKRWWAAQTRDTDISRIHTLYQQALHYIRTQHEQAERMFEYMAASMRGLSNLKTTYKGDPTVIARLDIIIDQVRQRISDLRPDLLKNIDFEEQTSAQMADLAAMS